MSSKSMRCLSLLGCSSSLLAVIVLASSSPGVAQIVPDATLPINSVVTPNGNTFTITGGTPAGSNLFHSFAQFSLPSGTAFFNNDLNITNIISRVTGGSISNINGTLQANGNANLFLINPSGIIFGQNASLNIGGSFVGTTANGIQFSDGTVFGNTNLSSPPLLTVSVPLGLQYGNNPGSIQVQGSTLEVNPGQSLALVGGDVSMDGGRFGASGGRIEIGSVAAGGNIGLSVNNPEVRLSFADGVPRSDVSITNGAELNVREGAGGGGDIAINARSINISGADIRVRAGIDSRLGSTGSQAGDIELNATETINIDGAAFSNVVLGVGNGGDINITTGSLSLTNGAQLNTSTFGTGDAGDVRITAKDTISLDESTISNNVESRGVGNGGNIEITTGSLSLTNGSRLTTSTLGTGDAGEAKITAKDTISLDGRSGILNRVLSGAVGNGGNIDITTGSLYLVNGSQLTSFTRGQGNAGNVNIVATDDVSINVPIDELNLRNSQGGGAIFASIEPGGIGNGGNINISTGSLYLTDAAQLIAINRRGKGDAGSVNIRATNTISLSGVIGRFTSGIGTSVLNGSEGDGGNIDIQTNLLFLTDGAVISASNSGTGDSGSIVVKASDSIRLEDQATISADTLGGGGNINLNSPLILLRHNSDISTNADGTNNTAGNINIDSIFLVAIPKEDSDITSDSTQFRGGTVTVNASGGVFGLKFRQENIPESSDITAKGRDASLSGTVTINTPVVDPSQGLVQLPETLSDPSNQIATGCAAAQGNSFIITGRGGLPEDPTGIIRGQTVWRDLQDFSQGTGGGQASSQNPQALIGKPAPRLVEANSWMYDEKGNVVLVAIEGNGTPTNYKSKLPQCQDLSSLKAPIN